MPAPVPITRADDARVAHFADVTDRALKARDGLFLAESERVLRRLLESDTRVHSMLLTPGRHERMGAVLPEDVPVFLADVEVMSEIAGFPIHRGVLAAGHRPAEDALTPERAVPPGAQLVVVAEGLTDASNVGTLFRNACAFGADAVVLDPTCADPLYRKAIRASLGNVFHVPWAITDDVGWLSRGRGLRVIAAERTPAARPLWELKADAPLAVVFGQEEGGVSDATLSVCDAVYEIPMIGGVASLNVTAATAVFLYEITRSAGR